MSDVCSWFGTRALTARTVAVGALSLLLMALLLGGTGCASTGSDEPAPERRRVDVWRGGIPVMYALLDDTSYNREHKFGVDMPEVKYITIHNTANRADALAERTYLNRRQDGKYISFHYAVDEEGAIQILPQNIGGWHAGDGRGSGNTESIGIEICRSICYGDKEMLYRFSEANGARLAASLLDEYNLPMDALKKHEDWSGKHCPHRILDEGRWEEFKQTVASHRKGQNRPIQP